MPRTLMITLAAAFFALPVFSQERTPYSYADFEASVPHIDLDACPEGLAEGDVFCRVTLNNDALHIHVFEVTGEQLFIAVHSYYEDEFALNFGR